MMNCRRSNVPRAPLLIRQREDLAWGKIDAIILKAATREENSQRFQASSPLSLREAFSRLEGGLVAAILRLRNNHLKSERKIASSKIEKHALPPTQMTSAKQTKIKLPSSRVSSILLEKISFISFFHLVAEAPTAGRSRGRVCSFEVSTLVTNKCCRY